MSKFEVRGHNKTAIQMRRLTNLIHEGVRSTLLKKRNRHCIDKDVILTEIIMRNVHQAGMTSFNSLYQFVS